MEEAQTRRERGRGARGADRAVEPQRPGEGAGVAARQPDHRGGNGHVETEVCDVRRGRNGRVGLILRPRRVDHVAGRLGEHGESEQDRRGAARSPEERVPETGQRRGQHREIFDDDPRRVRERDAEEHRNCDEQQHVPGQQDRDGHPDRDTSETHVCPSTRSTPGSSGAPRKQPRAIYLPSTASDRDTRGARHVPRAAPLLRRRGPVTCRSGAGCSASAISRPELLIERRPVARKSRIRQQFATRPGDAVSVTLGDRCRIVASME